jgi:hypothetical protein
LPKATGVPLSFALNWFLAVLVAQWLLGYKSSYPEYFDEKEEWAGLRLGLVLIFIYLPFYCHVLSIFLLSSFPQLHLLVDIY